jgi:large subunit ribosomal protein L44
MQHAPKRLASTATRSLKPTIPLSSLQSFPPPEALAASSSKQQTFFDTESWAAIQPPPLSALTALAHRIGLGKVLTSPELILQACTHQSILPLYSKLHPNKSLPLTNTNLATLGNSLLGLFATEYVHALYPHLPTRVLKAAVSAYVGPPTCASVAKEMGATPLLRWRRTVRIVVISLPQPPVHNFFFLFTSAKYTYPSCGSTC